MCTGLSVLSNSVDSISEESSQRPPATRFLTEHVERRSRRGCFVRQGFNRRLERQTRYCAFSRPAGCGDPNPISRGVFRQHKVMPARQEVRINGSRGVNAKPNRNRRGFCRKAQHRAGQSKPGATRRGLHSGVAASIRCAMFHIGMRRRGRQQNGEPCREITRLCYPSFVRHLRHPASCSLCGPPQRLRGCRPSLASEGDRPPNWFCRPDRRGRTSQARR
jgi:hypothetical protein